MFTLTKSKIRDCIIRWCVAPDGKILISRYDIVSLYLDITRTDLSLLNPNYQGKGTSPFEDDLNALTDYGRFKPGQYGVGPSRNIPVLHTRLRLLSLDDIMVLSLRAGPSQEVAKEMVRQLAALFDLVPKDVLTKEPLSPEAWARVVALYRKELVDLIAAAKKRLDELGNMN